jgi:hypothetical protein
MELSMMDEDARSLKMSRVLLQDKVRLLKEEN